MSSVLKNIASALVASAALAFAAAPALAQDHGGGHEGQHQSEQNAGELQGHAAGNEGGGEHHTAGERAEAGEHGGTHGHADHAPEPINWTQFGGTRATAEGPKPNPPPFIASLLNFAILATILFVIVRRAVNPALASRRAAIEADINEAQRLRAEAEAMHREYSDRIAKMDDEFAQLRAEMVKAGEAEFARIVAEAGNRAEQMKREAEQTIAVELRALRTELLRETVEAAVASAEQAVRTGVSAQDQSRLADDYVANLEKTATTGARAAGNGGGVA